MKRVSFVLVALTALDYIPAPNGRAAPPETPDASFGRDACAPLEKMMGFAARSTQPDCWS